MTDGQLSHVHIHLPLVRGNFFPHRVLLHFLSNEMKGFFFFKQIYRVELSVIGGSEDGVRRREFFVW